MNIKYLSLLSAAFAFTFITCSRPVWIINESIDTTSRNSKYSVLSRMHPRPYVVIDTCTSSISSLGRHEIPTSPTVDIMYNALMGMTALLADNDTFKKYAIQMTTNILSLAEKKSISFIDSSNAHSDSTLVIPMARNEWLKMRLLLKKEISSNTRQNLIKNMWKLVIWSKDQVPSQAIDQQFQKHWQSISVDVYESLGYEETEFVDDDFWTRVLADGYALDDFEDLLEKITKTVTLLRDQMIAEEVLHLNEVKSHDIAIVIIVHSGNVQEIQDYLASRAGVHEMKIFTSSADDLDFPPAGDKKIYKSITDLRKRIQNK